MNSEYYEKAALKLYIKTYVAAVKAGEPYPWLEAINALEKFKEKVKNGNFKCTPGA